MKLEFSQAEHIQTLENKVTCLEEGNYLFRELLIKQHSHIQEEDQKFSEPETHKEVIYGT
jgi:hypothetical protein